MTEQKITENEGRKNTKGIFRASNLEKTDQVEGIKTAIVNGRDLPVSLKHAIALSNFIKGKEIDFALGQLEQVKAMKKPVPMRGEIPHRKGIMSGRYPVKASKEFIRLLKSLKANAIAKDLELEKYRLHAISNNAPRPYRRFGQGRFKRSHVTIRLLPIIKQNKQALLKKTLEKNEQEKHKEKK